MEERKQQQFPWAAPDGRPTATDVVLDPATTAAAIALLARALIAIIRAVQEIDHER
jgi:hypothetical protein